MPAHRIELVGLRGCLYLKLRLPPRGVPEVQDFDKLPRFIDPVVDEEWRVNKPPDATVPFYARAKTRGRRQKIDVVEKALRKRFGGSGVMLPRPIQNGFQVG